MDNFNFESYTLNNPLLQEDTNDKVDLLKVAKAVTDIQRDVKAAINRHKLSDSDVAKLRDKLSNIYK
jgi:hypothetical protein